eukprot:6996728-Prorocentrum_lima.AAC.1
MPGGVHSLIVECKVRPVLSGRCLNDLSIMRERRILACLQPSREGVDGSLLRRGCPCFPELTG